MVSGFEEFHGLMCFYLQIFVVGVQLDEKIDSIVSIPSDIYKNSVFNFSSLGDVIPNVINEICERGEQKPLLGRVLKSS